jgi:short-subunit dehydrogenase
VALGRERGGAHDPAAIDFGVGARGHRQSLRAQLVGPGVSVHAVLAGPMDTDMIRDWDIPKTSPRSVARAILDGVEAGEEEIFPDPMSATLARSWRDGAIKDLERRNAAAVQAMSIPA